MIHFYVITFFESANTIHPTNGKIYFDEKDERKNFSLPVLDPRIHFALNCGAKVRSC